MKRNKYTIGDRGSRQVKKLEAKTENKLGNTKGFVPEKVRHLTEKLVVSTS